MRKWIGILAVLASVDAMAWECRYERNIEQTLDVSGSESLAIAAGAGDLEITGVRGQKKVSIRGTACASKEEWLDDIRIETEAGEQARLGVVLPGTDNHWSWSSWGSRYAYLDLVLEVPRNLALDVRDSSGEINMADVGAVKVGDSSGDLDIRGAGGSVEISDSSGDISVRDVEGDLTIVSDSSGAILGQDIDGSVRVISDSSGGMRFEGVSGNVVVERDSSGDIRVARVGGDFTVLRDGSGDIRSAAVEGKVSIPRGKR
jgi:hypothetical protein